MVENQDIQADRLIIFGRYPVPGQTKTGLIPELGPTGAAELQRQLTEKAITTAKAFIQGRGIELNFHFEGGNTKKMFKWLDSGMIFSQQEPGNLGERMQTAFLKSFQSGRRRIVLVGTDIPGLSIDLMHKAFDALTRHDVVIGPSIDGGYWLIGMKHPFNLFQDIAWGTETVFAQTIALAKKEGLGVFLLDPLTDIDTGEDLAWHVPIGSVWTWNSVNGNEQDPLVFNLSAGAHTLKISGREDGTKLDRLLITNDMAFVPSEEDPNNVPPAVVGGFMKSVDK